MVPPGLPEWREVMDGWGGKMLAAVEAVAEMAARGMGLPPDAFTSRMRQGPHLLAPTGEARCPGLHSPARRELPSPSPASPAGGCMDLNVAAR